MNLWVIQVGEPLPEIDGPVRPFRCAMLVDEAVRRGDQVVRWASTFNHFSKSFRADRTTSRLLKSGPEVVLLHGPGYRVNRSPRRLYHHQVEARAFRNVSQAKSPPDVVLCCLPTLQLAEAAVSYGQRAGVPVVIDVRDLWPDHYLTILPRALRRLGRWLLAPEFWRLRRLLRRAAGITAVSRTYLEWGLHHAGRSPRPADGVFPIGYPPFSSNRQDAEAMAERARELRAKFSLPDDAFVAVFVGSLASSYDVPTLIDAACLVERQGRRNLRIVIAGTGPYEAALRRQAREASSVIFTGWLADSLSVQALLKLAQVGLTPYTPNPTISLPNKPFEYMAAGLPQLSSLCGEMEQILQQDQIGWHYPPTDSRALADRLCWCMDHPSDLAETRQRALDLFHQRYQCNVIYPAMLDHLQAVAAKVLTPRQDQSSPALPQTASCFPPPK